MSTPAPQIGFGEGTGFIPFVILRTDERGAGVPDWTRRPIVVRRHIPGSTWSARMDMGAHPATVTYRLALSHAEYWRLVARLNTSDTLTVLSGMTSLRGTVTTVHGVTYERLGETYLVDLQRATLNPDGTAEVDAVFEREVF